MQHDSQKISRVDLASLFRLMALKLSKLPEDWAFNEVAFTFDISGVLVVRLIDTNVALSVPVRASLDDTQLVKEAKDDIMARLDAMNEALRAVLPVQARALIVPDIPASPILDLGTSTVVDSKTTCKVHGIPLNSRGECPACNKEKRA